MSAAQSALLGAGGGIKPSGLLNGSSTFTAAIKPGGALQCAPAKTVFFNPPAASALGVVLSLSGKGALTFVAIWDGIVVARTLRLKITLDAVVIFDATGSDDGAGTQAWLAVGGLNGGSAIESPPLFFDSSLLIEAASSSTAGAGVGYRYIPRA